LGSISFCDENGRVVGFFHPVHATEQSSNQTKSPVSNDEIEIARQQKTGRALTDIVADLNRQQ
jgi:hypothetical protein